MWQLKAVNTLLIHNWTVAYVTDCLRQAAQFAPGKTCVKCMDYELFYHVYTTVFKAIQGCQIHVFMRVHTD